MMTCKELTELMMAYCDGELPKESCELICQHIRACVSCHHFLESYQITMRLCRELPMAAIPEQLLAKLRAALKDEHKGGCEGP
jgi:anti-sigma factor RsiW